MQHELKRNLACSEGSFWQELCEHGEWNEECFWRLHLDLVNLAKQVDANAPMKREIASALVLLQQRVLNLIVAHFNKNDVFEIASIDTRRLIDFAECFDMAVIGAITGAVEPESSFELVNPYLPSI